MGYTTDFNGEFTITPPLSPEHRAYLTQFAEIRHVRRNVKKLVSKPDPLRIAVGLPLGSEGCFYVGTVDKYASQNDDGTVIDGNAPPGSTQTCTTCRKEHNAHYCQYKKTHGQPLPCPGGYASHLGHIYAPGPVVTTADAAPGLWCQWVPTEDGTALVWDEGEKFYDYTEWLDYLIEHFLSPWGYMLAGEVYWQGEDPDDRGRMRIVSPSNDVIVERAVITYV